ncbi:minor tail protein [Microbacterium phage Pikmin]|uniref:Minor tail protein n=3 Tax=Pikminvirus pikmin TaxID=2560596 RepID=A0A2P1CKL3_9CAUD|nr:minor tail protein [Microbacterium phage Pikmin]AVJ51013.1 minor tail protein [Microbacterium phage Pajaza]AVJ51160.1 minor tail protein [Microbacterium phage Pikmin]AVJ51718.1 minor tail protein [Microbacterium phage Casey]
MGQRVALWHVAQTIRTDAVLDRYGDVIDDILLVGYELRSTGLVSLNIQNTVETVRAKWPNIRWWLTIQAFSSDAFRRMADPNDPLTIDVFNQLDTIFETYHWLYGLDIDAEGFQGNMTTAEVMASYRALGDYARSKGLKVSAALPAATEGNYSVGGESWLDYELFGAYFDQVAIMTYDFAWSGSAPGPIAPRFWVQQVYDWATSVIPPEKILMGVPAYGQNWSIHVPTEELPGYPGWPYRGNSGAYYWFWYMGIGEWGSMSGDDDPVNWNQTRAGWLTYRDIETNSPFMLVGCYWWSTATHITDQVGLTESSYNGKPYLTRYGVAAADTVGEMADQTVDGEYATHSIKPIQVIDSRGNWHNQDSHNLTLEMLQRDPQSATIMDDDCANTGSLDIYYTKSGSWSHWRSGDPLLNPRTPGQFRVAGAGTLSLTAINGGGEYHVEGRFQFPGSSGRAGVYHGSYQLTVNTGGSLILSRNGTTLATWSVSAVGTSSTPFSGRVIVQLRVRGNRARVYYGFTENEVTLVGTYTDSSYTDGPSGMISLTGPVWFDHVRWGDAWWYNPREAWDVQVGGFTIKEVGRIPRTNVTWDDKNRFRVNTDVEERDTRDKSISLDWEFAHAKGIGIPAGTTREVKFIPRDIDCWLGTVYLCDPKGTALCHYSDVEYMAHCRNLADQEWGLNGIAVWRLGQEDTRFWERVKGARLDPATRIPILA